MSFKKHKIDYPNDKCIYCLKPMYKLLNNEGMLTECDIGKKGSIELLKESIVIYNVMKRLKNA
jgi:hypothetical protein